jgi:hypothetical protein
MLIVSILVFFNNCRSYIINWLAEVSLWIILLNTNKLLKKYLCLDLFALMIVVINAKSEKSVSNPYVLDFVVYSPGRGMESLTKEQFNHPIVSGQDFNQFTSTRCIHFLLLGLYRPKQRYSANERWKVFAIFHNESKTKRSEIEPCSPDSQSNVLTMELIRRFKQPFWLCMFIYTSYSVNGNNVSMTAQQRNNFIIYCIPVG